MVKYQGEGEERESGEKGLAEKRGDRFIRGKKTNKDNWRMSLYEKLSSQDI